MGSEGPQPGPERDPGDLAERLELARQHVESLLPGAQAAEGPQPVFLLYTADGIRDRFLELRRRLAPLGLLPLLRDQGGRPVLILVPKPAPGRWAWQTNALLLLITIFTTFRAGYLFSQSLVQTGYLSDPVRGGIAFSASLLLILVAHEMGHKLVSVRRGIDASLPYFIPMIPFRAFPIGTLGAVIFTRTPAPNRDTLMDLGASGPIAGFLVAIPVLIYGITHSFVVSPEAVKGFGEIPDPLLIQWLVQILLHPASNAAIVAHPVYFAGWLGLFVTSLNLLPSGMLDGGHAVRAALGARAHRIISIAGVVIAVLMGALLMAILMALMMRRGHAGPLDDLTPMSPSRRLVGLALVVVFVVSVVAIVPLFSLLQSLR